VSGAASAVAGWASSLGRLAQLPAELPARVAPGIEAAAVATASSGTSPSGAPWAPTQSGGQPLAGAASELSVTAGAGAVVVTLDGPSAIHHNGTARGGVRRQVIPDDGEVPPGYVDAIDAAFAEAVA
jgi:hypothetical protein